MALELRINRDANRIIIDFIKGSVKNAKAKGIVVGLSGGLDSSLVAKLSVDALGKGNVKGIMMPSADSGPNDLKYAKILAKWLGIRCDVVRIGPMVRSFAKGLAPNKKELGNIKARCRMIVVHQKAMKGRSLVAGTGNKSELLVGYFTKYGDGGVDILPIGDLYKTQVRRLSMELEIPKEIIDRPPSAGLWEGQTDEGELGITYELLDKILLGLERGMSPKDIAKGARTSMKQVARIEGMVEDSVHKRKMPQIPKIGLRTIGLDWRE